MKGFKESIPDYLKILNERVQKSRVYTPYQFTGLQLATILDDQKHKSLYIKMSKNNDAQKLLSTAKTVAENKNIKNKGAYFMKVFYGKGKN